jgi:hypothetical protein
MSEFIRNNIQKKKCNQCFDNGCDNGINNSIANSIANSNI